MNYTKIKIFKNKAIKKKAISSIIVIVLIILMTTILIGGILSWSKNAVKNKLDVVTENSGILSELECKNAKYKIEFCTVDYVTKDINLIFTNKSALSFGNFVLTIEGQNYDGNMMKLVGRFSDVIPSGKSALLSTGSSTFNYEREDYSDTLFNIETVTNFTLTNGFCSTKLINLKDCEVIYSSVPTIAGLYRNWLFDYTYETASPDLLEGNGSFIDLNNNFSWDLERYDGNLVQSNTLTFDGNDDYVNINDSNNFHFGTDDFSISTRIYYSGYVNSGSVWNSIISKDQITADTTIFLGYIFIIMEWCILGLMMIVI